MAVALFLVLVLYLMGLGGLCCSELGQGAWLLLAPGGVLLEVPRMWGGHIPKSRLMF